MYNMIITPTLIAAIAKIAYDTYGPQVEAWIRNYLASNQSRKSSSIQVSDDARVFAKQVKGYDTMSPTQKELVAQLAERAIQMGESFKSTKTTQTTQRQTQSPINSQGYDSTIFKGLHISERVQKIALEVGQKYKWTRSEILNFAIKLEKI